MKWKKKLKIPKKNFFRLKNMKSLIKISFVTVFKSALVASFAKRKIKIN